MHHHRRLLPILAIMISLLVAPDLWAQSKIDGPQVTFVELGSVKCVPCRQMQPVMRAIEKRYGSQVSVVFYDVWKSEQREYAEKYGIRLIPTQVFLDKDGKEFYRHEGFFPEAEIDKLLRTRGLNALSGG
jgi:thioredoxin 1